ncbi:MAG: NUDIX domain-containing protein [Gammaproteobacteria bacterium]|nr:NUDIX domain-containing protein [Gammaproteobacteria bacterium]
MHTELLILRHGESEWNNGMDDFVRSLQDQGKRDAQRIGVWLSQNGLVPDYLISSPAERADATAQEVCRTMGLDPGDICRNMKIYAADVAALLGVLRASPVTSRRVMIVGHNPGLEGLVGYLSDAPVSLLADGGLLPTAALGVLELNSGWTELARGCAHLKSIVRPGSLPKKFPYPQSGGTELRDRPEYYYTQSSVIPYRWRNGEIEVLVITSKKRKHWLVPKGIRDPGYSLQNSAAKEAMEEAGVEGVVTESAIGHYAYTKWGGSCSVVVYPMEVTGVLSEAQWMEPQRLREWVTPQVAAHRLRQVELKPMILKLASSLSPR